MPHSSERFSLTKTVHGTPPIRGVPFERVKDDVLGRDYTLSLVFIGDRLARRLSREYKGKDKPSNVLSFPLSDSEGEIFINPWTASREAAAFDETPRQHIAHLYVHGLLHLKGFAHGTEMENEERRVLQRHL